MTKRKRQLSSRAKRNPQRYKMEYKCFQCDKKVSDDYLRKKIRCPYCGSKILFKARTVATKVKAR